MGILTDIRHFAEFLSSDGGEVAESLGSAREVPLVPESEVLGNEGEEEGADGEEDHIHDENSHEEGLGVSLVFADGVDVEHEEFDAQFQDAIKGGDE